MPGLFSLPLPRLPCALRIALAALLLCAGPAYSQSAETYIVSKFFGYTTVNLADNSTCGLRGIPGTSTGTSSCPSLSNRTAGGQLEYYVLKVGSNQYTCPTGGICCSNSLYDTLVVETFSPPYPVQAFTAGSGTLYYSEDCKSYSSVTGACLAYYKRMAYSCQVSFVYQGAPPGSGESLPSAPCSSPVLVSAPECKGGMGISRRGQGFEMLNVLLDKFPMETSHSPGLNVACNESLSQCGFLKASDGRMLPNGSECSSAQTPTHEFVYCSNGMNEFPPDPPDPPEPDVPPYDPCELFPGSALFGCSVNCSSEPNHPSCQPDRPHCEQFPSSPECSGEAPSSGSGGGSSAGSGDGSSAGSGDGTSSPGGSGDGPSSNSSGGTPSSNSAGGVNPGGGQGGIGCPDLANCNWARYDVQILQLGISEDILEILKNIKGGLEDYSYSEVNAIHDLRDAISGGFGGGGDSLGGLHGSLGGILDALSGLGSGGGSGGSGSGGGLDGILSEYSSPSMSDSLGGGEAYRQRVKEAVGIDSSSFSFMGSGGGCPVLDASFDSGVLGVRHDGSLSLCDVHGYDVAGTLRSLLWLSVLFTALFMNLQTLKTGGRS